MENMSEVENNMTLRIHKTIGYGIADIVVNNGKVADDRFNQDGFLCNEKSQGDDKYHLQSFFDRLCENDPEKWMVELYSMDFHAALLCECVHFTTIEDKGVLCLCPPNKCQVWTREDDVIDYCQESKTVGKSHCEFLGHGIPSYRYLMDSRSGRKLPTIIAMEFLALSNTYKNCTMDVERYKIEGSLADLASELQFGTIDEAAANIAPLVPEVVAEFCKFLRVFKDERTILSLRPMILSYWR